MVFLLALPQPVKPSAQPIRDASRMGNARLNNAVTALAVEQPHRTVPPERETVRSSRVQGEVGVAG